jgi:hypothetical protein
MKNNFRILLFLIMPLIAFVSCQKGTVDSSAQTPPANGGGTPGSPAPGNSLVLSYGDSIFYLSSTASNIKSPLPMTVSGKFIGFPKGIELDSINGKIDLTESEMGLRYKIMFIPTGSTDTISTKIVLSGINFYDGIYKLTTGDSIANSIYNAKGQPYVPGLFGTGLNNSFDDGHGCNNQGCAVSFVNGKINLAKSLRDGAISSSNDSQKEFTYYYKMDDPSNKALNKLKIKLYYYNTQADIPQYLWDILLIDHAGTILRQTAGTNILLGTAKPRPPCIIIVGH